MLPRPNRVNNFIKRAVLRTLIRRFDKSTVPCVGVLGLMLWSSLPARPQDVDRGGTQSQQETKDEVKSAWDELLRDVIPEAVADPALVVEQVPVEKGVAADFAGHFFFETSTHYIRQETTFSGRPTATGVINVERGEVANPDGIPFPPAFQPNSDHVYSFMNWATRGWLSPHVNTNFSLRYRQDLTSVLEGSPSLGVINTFRANRLFELLSGFVEIGQLGSTGASSRSSLKVGRQFVYGAFYRRINLQNRFFFIENERVFGVLGGFTLKIDQRTRIYFDYSLDDDYFLFRPSVQRAHLLRVGVHWRY